MKWTKIYGHQVSNHEINVNVKGKHHISHEKFCKKFTPSRFVCNWALMRFLVKKRMQQFFRLKISKKSFKKLTKYFYKGDTRKKWVAAAKKRIFIKTIVCSNLFRMICCLANPFWGSLSNTLLNAVILRFRSTLSYFLLVTFHYWSFIAKKIPTISYWLKFLEKLK